MRIAIGFHALGRKRRVRLVSLTDLLSHLAGALTSLRAIVEVRTAQRTSDGKRGHPVVSLHQGLHHKVMMLDDEWAIGTASLDNRSFRLNF